MKEKNEKKSESSLKMLTKSSVWDITEQDILDMWPNNDEESDLQENSKRYFDLLRLAFDIEKIPVDKPEVIKKFEDRGYTVGLLKMHEEDEQKWAIMKRPIKRVTDLTYENIRHITASHLLEVIDRNFGGGWDSLSQAIQDIILAGFDISTTTLPKDRLRNPGGMYETKLNDGFEVLEIEKGNWVEAIFAKAKPKVEKAIEDDDLKLKKRSRLTLADAEEDEDDEDIEIVDNYNMVDEDDDDFDEEKLTEESYRTTFDTDPEDLTLDSLEAAEDDDF